MTLAKQLVVLLLLLIGGWAALRYYRLHQRLYRQLEELTTVLTVENDWLAANARYTLRGIETSVAKNHNQLAEVALLHRSETLQASINQLLDTLQACGDQLRRATGNSLVAPLRHPGTAIGPVLGTTRRQALGRQLAACADTLRRLGPAENAPLAFPVLAESQPVVEALADLSQLESTLLTRQKSTLQHVSKAIGAPAYRLYTKAIAAAESEVVAPGDTYHARLLMVGYYRVPAARMTCNGWPVPVGPDGIGQVSFRAPSRPGPAIWTGTIRFKQNDHDTTFQVTVPYRVAHR